MILYQFCEALHQYFIDSLHGESGFVLYLSPQLHAGIS